MPPSDTVLATRDGSDGSGAEPAGVQTLEYEELASASRSDDAGGQGEPGADGPSLDVFVYPNTSLEEDGNVVYDDAVEARTSVAAALEHMGEQLLDAEVIDAYGVYRYLGYTECATEDDPGGVEYFNEFQDWIRDPDVGPGRISSAGVHLSVTNHTNFASAQATKKGETPHEPRPRWRGTRYGPGYHP